MDDPTILRPVRAKAHVGCYALTGRKEKHMSISQGFALGYKIKGFQPSGTITSISMPKGNLAPALRW